MDKSSKNEHIEHLLRSLDVQKDAFVESSQKIKELLSGTTSASSTAASSSKDVEKGDQKNDTNEFALRNALSPGAPSILSRGAGEDSDDEHDNDDLLYAQEPLRSRSFDLDGLGHHLSSNAWDEYGWEILKDVLANRMLRNASHGRQISLLPTAIGPVEDRSHLSGYQVWDVGHDGAVLAVEAGPGHNMSRAMAIWHVIKDLNPSSRERKAVGRITIMRELSPILFGALHYTLNDTFDMDDVFKQLIVADASRADVHRAFDIDPRRQSSKLFVFQYFTIIGDDCKPMPWQMASEELDTNPKHILITRCNSVVVLALTGKPIKQVRNPSRRAVGQNSHGNVYDPWSSWHLLNLQCFPDLKSSTDVHDATKHYVNGPEAFLITLLGEFRDAQRRFEDINKAITKLITPPSAFMFDAQIRDDLLFEDEKFTYVRRYFWAYQTLGIMNDSIRSIIDEFEHNFTEELWEGKDKTLWPLTDQDSPRSVYYKKRMAALRLKFEAQMRAFRTLMNGNEERRTEIRGLREELYVGTSIQESRKSVDATETTVQQGHNIKLLTLVSIFFLPSQFVTSVFGMTNMPTNPSYWTFAVVLAAVCVPFFILIGSLNSTRGMMFWKRRVEAVFASAMKFFTFLGHRFKDHDEDKGEKDMEHEQCPSDQPRLRRTISSRHDQEMQPERTSARQALPRLSEESSESGQRQGESPKLGRRTSSRLAEMLKGERRKGHTKHSNNGEV